MASRLGSQLARFRSEFGLTQKDAASALGVGASTISKIETGSTEARATTAAGIRSAMKSYRDANAVTATVQTPEPAFQEPILTEDYRNTVALEFANRVAEDANVPDDTRAEARIVASLLARYA